MRAGGLRSRGSGGWNGRLASHCSACDSGGEEEEAPTEGSRLKRDGWLWGGGVGLGREAGMGGAGEGDARERS